MGIYTDILKREFPAIDDNVMDYVEGVLCGGVDDFNNCDDVYEAIGDILQEISLERSECDIKNLCEQFFKIMKPKERTNQKMLNAPVNIAEMAADMDNNVNDMKSIWVINRDNTIKVDSKKLEKAETKLQQKLEKRQDTSKKTQTNVKLQTASASQVSSKKDNKMESKGINRSMDIKIENFDLAFGDKILLQNADLILAFGRRYGLVGRNGLGKTTLLRMISKKQLQIPSHISVLHVEQEVHGDDTKALDSVLECDTVRNKLLAKEKELLACSADETNTLNLNDELNKIYAELQNIEADKAISKASIILKGLGFSQEMQDRPTKSFSGGWRMRLALARALFSQPDLLLLDEPTNMLDIKAIIWLENYLQNWPTTLLIVSHDRSLLDSVPTDIIYLHSQRLDAYKGNYEQFIKTKTEKLKAQRREYEAQLAHRAHVQEFIDKFRYNANRASSVQSKIKMLEKLPKLKPVEKDYEVKLKFPEVEGLNPPVLTLSEVTFGYDNVKPIFRNVNLCANSDSRICIVGENGAGKTTLLKLIVGQLNPTSGNISIHRGLRLGYFAQHHVDNLDMNLTCVEILQTEYPGKQDEEYRRQLGSFGVSGSLAMQPIASLSGGQKSRVAFAKLCMAEPNFLVLDEPTNHLDIETIDALGKAINQYKGGIILVSHDERLIRVVCKELWVCAEGNVHSMEGGIEAYKQEVLKEIESK